MPEHKAAAAIAELGHNGGLPTFKYLEECFEYDELTGVLTWRVRPRHHFKNNQSHSACNSRFAGKPAGTSKDRGYLIVKVDGRSTYVHRIAWAISEGLDLIQVPDEIDHRDLNTSNNRKENLRTATRPENGSNRSTQSNNTSGAKGVDWHKQGDSWRARITVNNEEISLGLFKNKEDAIRARGQAQHLHGEFARAA